MIFKNVIKSSIDCYCILYNLKLLNVCDVLKKKNYDFVFNIFLKI